MGEVPVPSQREATPRRQDSQLGTLSQMLSRPTQAKPGTKASVRGWALKLSGGAGRGLAMKS